MNTKGVITIIVIIVLVVIGINMWTGNPSEPNTDSTVTTDEGGLDRDDFATTDKDTTDQSLLSRLESVSVAASESGSKVALVNGKASFNSDGVKGTVTLGDVAVSKTAGGVNFIVSTLSVNSGGSGTYHYVVLFEDSGSEITDKSYTLVGDRVRITGVRADDVSGGLVVTVSYLEHDKGEPLASAPTVPRTKILVVENGMFNAAKEITL